MNQNQGSKGIRQWVINLCTSPTMKTKIKSSVDLDYWLKRMGTQLNDPINENSLKWLSQRIRKLFKYYKTLGTNVMNSPISTANGRQYNDLGFTWMFFSFCCKHSSYSSLLFNIKPPNV